MRYMDSQGKYRQANGFHLFRVRGSSPAEFHLLLLVNYQTIPELFGKRGIKCHEDWMDWHDIPLEHGGKLAMTHPSFWELREVSFREAPLKVRQQTTAAIEHIKTHGTPFENDESVSVHRMEMGR